MKRDYTLFVEDILESIIKIDEFIGEMDFSEFVQDDKTKCAVVRKLEIIGEATKNIPQEMRQRFKELPWSDMARMRDKMAHLYFGINYKIVWEVIKKQLPGIEPQIEKMLEEMENNENKPKFA